MTIDHLEVGVCERSFFVLYLSAVHPSIIISHMPKSWPPRMALGIRYSIILLGIWYRRRRAYVLFLPQGCCSIDKNCKNCGHWTTRPFSAPLSPTRTHSRIEGREGAGSIRWRRSRFIGCFGDLYGFGETREIGGDCYSGQDNPEQRISNHGYASQNTNTNTHILYEA
jgi:hypothetical protein